MKSKEQKAKSKKQEKPAGFHGGADAKIENLPFAFCRLLLAVLTDPQSTMCIETGWEAKSKKQRAKSKNKYFVFNLPGRDLPL